MQQGKDYRDTPLWDDSLSLEERLDYLIGELTLEEKLNSLTTSCARVERLGITPFFMGGEAAHGIEARHDQDFNRGEPEETTCFPQPIGMSATWDPALLEKIGEAVGNEARVLYQRHRDGGLCRWAPTVDMERDPRWGRNEESYGEDPFLTGKMASAYIRGMRGNDPFYLRCGATLKHFYANNQEKDRTSASSSIDLRNKWEYYLEPFYRCIREGGAEAVMTSYNEINGVPAIVNRDVQKLLKDTFGLPGHVVCDGGDMMQTVDCHHYYTTHAETVANGLKAGVDCFTDNGQVVYESAKEALEKGMITMEDIDRSIRNSFRTRIRLGLYDRNGKNPYGHIPETELNSPQHAALAKEAARESLVLLKNEHAFLPLSKNEKRIALIGPLSNVWYKDWYCGVPPYQKTVLSGILEQYSGEVECFDGFDRIYLKSKGQYLNVREDQSLFLSEKSESCIWILEDWGDDSLLLKNEKSGLYIRAEEDGSIQAKSREAFSWFIQETVHFQETDKKTGFEIKTFFNQPIREGRDGCLNFREGTVLTFEKEVALSGQEKSRELAKNASVVIAVLGCNPVINSKEEIDRAHLQLPGHQEQLLKKVQEVNGRTALVLISNYPYAINWAEEHLPAVLWSASGCQEMGSAISEALFGSYAPAGRLNMTWYQSEKDLPPMEDYDIIRGNRTYQYFDGKPLYPFGHGLTYSTFRYKSLSVVRDDLRSLRVCFTVENTGKVVSDEVVQVYVRQLSSRVKRPHRQLKAFERLKEMKPGEKRSVSFSIPMTELRYFDMVTETMILEKGEYEIQVGSSSENIRLRHTLTVPGRTIRNRDGYQKVWSETFDDCRAIRLYQEKGQEERPFIQTGEDGFAVYQKLFFTEAPKTCVLTVKGSGRAELYKDGEKLAYCQVETGEEKREVVLEIPQWKQPKDGLSDVLLKISGKIGVQSFWFRKG